MLLNLWRVLEIARLARDHQRGAASRGLGGVDEAAVGPLNYLIGVKGHDPLPP